MKVLITGGAGYIGHHIAFALADAGHHPVILDELPAPRGNVFDYHQGDIADISLLSEIVVSHPGLNLVIHCAAKIEVEESILKPELYYLNNFSKPLAMIYHLMDLGVNKLIVSSTASLYNGETADCFDEQTAPNPTSPYAWSKYFLERALSDMSKVRDLRCVIFRYFNPIGSDKKSRTGFRGNNASSLLNTLIQCANSKTSFQINGIDWNTRDGSTIRDFVDVHDLADAHVKAAELVAEQGGDVPLNRYGLPVINLGSERGVTIKEFVSAFKQVIAGDLVVESVRRRPGDIIGGYASSALAREYLGWHASTPLQTSLFNSINWAAKSTCTKSA